MLTAEEVLALQEQVDRVSRDKALIDYVIETAKTYITELEE